MNNNYIISNLAISESNEDPQILPHSSSLPLQSEIYNFEELDNYQDSTSNSNCVTADAANQTKNFNTSKSKLEFEKTTIENIAYYEKKVRDIVVSQLSNEIQKIILHDEFIDGEISRSELYMKEICNNYPIDYVLKALMQVYASNLLETRILEGVLAMLSCVPYDTVAPDGQIMAIGLLSNKELEIRDRAIQCFEKWNSKKGVSILRSLECHPKWLQKYVEKVIIYLERDGIN